MRKPNDRVIRAIVVGGSLTVLVAFGYPLVDKARRTQDANRAFVELEKEFQTTQERNQRLQRIEQTLRMQKDELTKQNVTPKEISDVRDSVISMVRRNGGRLRSLEIQDGNKRPWAEEGDQPYNRDMPEFGTESEFELHSHALSLSVVGPLDSVLGIVRSLNGHRWLMSIEAMDLKPHDTDTTDVDLELTMTLFGLEIAPETTEDTFAFSN